MKRAELIKSLESMPMPPPQDHSYLALRLEGMKEKELASKKTRPRRKMNQRQRFLRSPEWREVRELMFNLLGRVCLKCGSHDKVQADHIKPRSKYPELQLDIDNLQPLCWCCNKAKGTHDQTDYRISLYTLQLL